MIYKHFCIVYKKETTHPTHHSSAQSCSFLVLQDFSVRAGQTVQILDTSDQDWWQARCSDRGLVGFIPSTYLARLMPGEGVLRVNQLCQMEDMRGELVTLNRDQVRLSSIPPLLCRG